MAQKIRVLLIFEILGRPPEHIKKALDDFVSTLGDKKGVELVSKTIHEPKLLEDKESSLEKTSEKKVSDLYTTFAEVEVMLDNINILFAIILNMLPSSVEIIQPEEIKLTNFELNSVASELAIKLHKYDEVAKTITIQNTNLVNQIKVMHQQMQEKKMPSQNITFTTGSKDYEKTKDENKKIKPKKAKKKK